MTMTVLSHFLSREQPNGISRSGAQDYAMNRLLGQMAQAHQKRAEGEIQKVEDRYLSRTSELGRDLAKWQDVKTEIGKATSELSGVIGQLRGMQARLEAMVSGLDQADNAASEDASFNPKVYATTFDALLKGVHDEAVSNSYGTNLLNRNGATYEYSIGPGGQTASIRGNYVGSEYTITEADGHKWKADMSDKLMRRYDSDDAATSEVGGMNGGVRLDAINGDDVTFTIAPDTASPSQYSGTISRTGIMMVNAWYYDGLSTQDGRDRARDDIESAKEGLELEIRRYEIAFTTAQFYEDRASTMVSQSRSDQGKIEVEKAKKIMKAQEELSRQFSVAQGSVAQALAMKNQYALNLIPRGSNVFAQKLLSILT